MDYISYILIGIGLSFDSFAASICAGALCLKSKFKIALKIAIVFAIFQGAMPFIGWLMGIQSKSLIEQWDHWIAFILLLLIGGKMIYDSFSDEEEESEAFFTKMSTLSVVAIATSIDALVVGISFGILESVILIPTIIIGITTFIFSFVGVHLGNYANSFFKNKVVLLGGLILIGIGVKILLEHTIYK